MRFIGFTGLPLTVYRRILDRRARARIPCDAGAPSCGLKLFRSAICMHSVPGLPVCLYAQGCRVAATSCDMGCITVIPHESVYLGVMRQAAWLHRKAVRCTLVVFIVIQ